MTHHHHRRRHHHYHHDLIIIDHHQVAEYCLCLIDAAETALVILVILIYQCGMSNNG